MFMVAGGLREREQGEDDERGGGGLCWTIEVKGEQEGALSDK